MPSFETLVAFTFAALLMNLSPGPSNFYVMARSISQGTKGGLAAVAGLFVGSLIHVAAAVLGLSTLLAYSPMAYTILKLCGAAYLIYLGINYFRRSEEKLIVEKNVGVKNYSKVFRESILVEVTNPKTGMFYLALLPQFIVPEAGPVAAQFLLLGLIVSISAIPCDLFVTYFSSRVANSIEQNPRMQVIQNRIAGSILTALGSYILISENR
ncbi:MAG: threonine transporter RhtB [SAR86 cluster bacterium]|uniref:Threonine transporter RhtB n=1 Tax=SAR86 cluster bacterium TaxID=2030880 RepID=A0A2A5AW68_9GAMM|nr:MAG: threonine transporter RhtB [SAR86 cluster bacterium]